MPLSVLIAGGGLSGLCVAHELAKHSIDFQLVEARDRLGGRILIEPVDYLETTETFPSSAVDLGPSWFWPGQVKLAHLINELSLSNNVYPQASEGLSVVEYANGTLQNVEGAASMAGSLRLDGGMQSLIRTLIQRIGNAGVIQTRSQITTVSRTAQGVTARILQDAEQHDLTSDCVVLAIPPRVVSRTINFDPDMSGHERAALESIPTWMASHAKVVVVYDSPFWQSKGLSGDAFSQRGPLVEIHDASPRHSDKHALFGFVGLDTEQRRGVDITPAVIEQLVRLFGDEAGKPYAVYLQDWALEPLTCTDLDFQTGGRAAAVSALPARDWNHGVIWAGTETAAMGGHANGYLEGAVEAGLRAARVVIEHL